MLLVYLAASSMGIMSEHGLLHPMCPPTVAAPLTWGHTQSRRTVERQRKTLKKICFLLFLVNQVL